MLGSDAYFLEESAHASLKVVSKDYFRDEGTKKI